MAFLVVLDELYPNMPGKVLRMDSRLGATSTGNCEKFKFAPKGVRIDKRHFFPIICAFYAHLTGLVYKKWTFRSGKTNSRLPLDKYPMI